MAQLKDTIIQGTLEIQGKDLEGKALILPEESKIYIGNEPFTGGASSEEIQQMGFITNDKIGGEELGLVKDGGNVTINADGTMTAPECAVKGVTVNGASIVGEDGVAEIPIAERGRAGVMAVNPNNMRILYIDGIPTLYLEDPDKISIDRRYGSGRHISPSILDYSVESAMGAPIGNGIIDGVFHYPAWSEETQKAAIERIGLKDYAKYKYFNFIEPGVNVEGNPTYDEIKEAVLSDVTPVLIHEHYIAYMTSGHWDAEAFEQENLPGFTFVTHRSDMNNHWKIKYTEFWCTKQDDGSTLWAVGEHYYIEDFVAEYGTTTYEELLNAFKSNKQLILHVPAGTVSTTQPRMYARLHRLDGNGDTRNFIFVCTELGKDHHFLLGYVDDWTYWYYDQESRFGNIEKSISSLNNNIGSMNNTLTKHTNTLNSNQTNINTLLQTAFDKFRGGFVNNAGTLHIKNPGIYLIMQGGTGNKTITINYPTRKEFEATDWSGIILLAYEGGIVTPIGIKSSLAFIDAFKLPGTFQGWTPDGKYSTTIKYPAKCVVAYLGNSNVNYLS